MSKRKSSFGSDRDGAAPEKQIRTSGRTNRGQGGRADQLTKVSKALTTKPSRKPNRDSESTNEPINPMAPGYLEGSRSKHKSLKVCQSVVNLVILTSCSAKRRADRQRECSELDVVGNDAGQTDMYCRRRLPGSRLLATW